MLPSSEPAPDIIEGIFAIDKPATTSSADVLSALQEAFVASETFSPLLKDTARKRAEQAKHQPEGQKRKSDEEERAFKMGHGGTLDPLASGVLIIGIGRGTKRLNDYLNCSKTYETVVLLGRSTDTYDVTGQVVDQASFAHITRSTIERALLGFAGTIRQAPPMYSALKINGIKACEYARTGRPLPRALESREMQVDECTLLEWYEGGGHNYKWPEDKLLVEGERPLDTMVNARCPAPAVRVRLTVSSGFYVRSFAHDLGIACGSYGIMAALRRTRQAKFATVDSAIRADTTIALDLASLKAGEGTWGPEVRSQLSSWMAANPARNAQHVDGRDPEAKRAAVIERETRPRQRHMGGRQGSTRKERRKQSKRNEAASVPSPKQSRLFIAALMTDS